MKPNDALGDLVAEIQDAIREAPGGGMTMQEIRQASGSGMTVVRNKVRDGVLAGKLRVVGWRVGMRIDGVRMRSPVYGPAEPKKGKKA